MDKDPSHLDSENWIEIPENLEEWIRNLPLESLDLSQRTYNRLMRSQITRINQVLEMRRSQLLQLHYFGEKSIEELKASLEAIFQLSKSQGKVDLDAIDLGYNKKRRELTILDRERNVLPRNLDQQIIDYGLDGLDINRQMYNLLRKGDITSVGGVLLETRDNLLKILDSDASLLAELEASVDRLLRRWR